MRARRDALRPGRPWRTGFAGLLAALGAELLAACGTAPPTSAGHREVLVLVNANSPISLAIGEYYRRAREVPVSNLLALPVPLSDPTLGDPAQETIGRDEFERWIRDPLEAFLLEHGLDDQIEIIVIAKGIPLRIRGGGCRLGPTYLRDCTRASVDAELAILFSGRDGSAGVEEMANAYFDADVPFARHRTLHPDDPLRYLVARLTGYQEPLDPSTGVPADVKALIDAATAPGSPRYYVVDEDPTQPPERAGGSLAMLRPAGAVLTASGLPVIHDRTPTFLSDLQGIAGYASWGSNDRHDPGGSTYGRIKARLYPGRFGPRAIAADVVSTNARSFTAPRGHGQSLVADLVRLGVSGAAGCVYEPLLPGVARPDRLLRHYAQGAPAGEAFWRSVPYLGWMNVYVGDPLMRATLIASPPTDRDGDGVPNDRDNCLGVPNQEQVDSDRDGYGNLCDPDVDGDGLVTTSWGIRSAATTPGDLERIAITASHGRFNPHHDLDGDGDVDEADLSLASVGLFHPPGPSGRAP